MEVQARPTPLLPDVMCTTDGTTEDDPYYAKLGLLNCNSLGVFGYKNTYGVLFCTVFVLASFSQVQTYKGRRRGVEKVGEEQRDLVDTFCSRTMGGH